MTARTGELGSIILERGKRGNFRRAVIVILIMAALILYVGGKVRIVRLGYQIEALEREKRELERANRALLIEASSLTSPARIEDLATKHLGMVMPPKENIVVVRRKAATQ